MDGGFAEYCAYPAGKVFKIHNLSDVDATLLEPASCAAHGLDKISPKLGSSVLMFGAGPTGLVLSQMLRHNGGCNVVVAAPEGLKMDLAKKLGAGDVSCLHRACCEIWVLILGIVLYCSFSLKPRGTIRAD
jgi:D-arabinitol dehydrogenase (NADP+)